MTCRLLNTEQKKSHRDPNYGPDRNTPLTESVETSAVRHIPQAKAVCCTVWSLLSSVSTLVQWTAFKHILFKT